MSSVKSNTHAILISVKIIRGHLKGLYFELEEFHLTRAPCLWLTLP